MKRCLSLVRPTHVVGGLLLVLSFSSVSSVSGDEFLVGKWADEEIRDHISELRGFAEDAPAGETALCLNRSFFVQTSHREHKISENRSYYVYDHSAEELGTQRITFSRKTEKEEFRGWILRADGSIQRLEEDDILWREGDDERVGELVFHYPNFQRGDVFGFSYRIRHPGPYPESVVTLAIDQPVASGHFYMRTRGEVGYRLTARNVRQNQISLRAEDVKNGTPHLLVADYRSIGALSDEPFRMPAVRRVPYLDLIIQATRVEFEDSWGRESAWIRVNTWNHRAGQARDLADSYVGKDRVAERTREILDDLAPDVTAEEALFDFVRLEIREESPSSGGFHEIARSAQEILERGVAGANEKCLLLHAMLREAGVPTNVAFLRSHHLGPLDLESPDLTQLPELAVVREDRAGHWLWPVRLASRPGELPPWLRRSTAFLPGYHIEAKLEDLRKDAALESGQSLNQYRKAYHRRLGEVKWYALLETEGDPFATFGAREEELAFEPAAAQVELTVGFRGSVLPADLQVGADDPARREFLSNYVEERWPGVTAGAEEQRDHRVSSTDSLVTLSASIGGWELPRPDESVWILPPQVVFGQGRLGEWNGPDRGPMFIDCGERYDYRVRIPLPDGWSSALVPEGLRVVNPRLSYEADFSVADGFLLIDRTLIFRAGVTPAQYLEEMDADIQKILAFETRPVVLESETARSR